MTESIKTDVANIEVVHGVQFLRKMNHPQEIVHSYYNRHLFEYVTNDGDCVRLFHHDGRMKDIRVGAFQAERFIYIPPARSYVAWKAGTNSLRVRDYLSLIVRCIMKQYELTVLRIRNTIRNSN